MKIGVITTGHGPRDEYQYYHEALLKALGADTTFVVRHALEGLSWEQIVPHLVDHTVPNIGAHLHQPGATGNQYGPGWSHPYVELGFMVERFQHTTDLLEREDGVDMVLLACAAEIPEGSVKANTFFIHPRDLMFDLMGHLTRGTRRRPKVGLMVSMEHADLDKAEWERKPWFKDIDFHLMPTTETFTTQDAVKELNKAGVDLAFYFGYGVGLAPFISDTYIADLEATLGAPLIVPHRVATLFIRNLVRPGMDDRKYMPAGWWKKP